MNVEQIAALKALVESGVNVWWVSYDTCKLVHAVLLEWVEFEGAVPEPAAKLCLSATDGPFVALYNVTPEEFVTTTPVFA